MELIEQPQTKKHVTYLEQNVRDAAIQRIIEILPEYDEVWVAFSGGKDSLVVLTLVEHVWALLGRTDKINVLFRDEELIVDEVVDFVQMYAESGRYNFRYLAVPMSVGCFMMGKHLNFTAWDANRTWHRQPPSYAERWEGRGVADENNMDAETFPDKSKRIGVLTGMRADESLKRYQAITRKKHGRCYVGKSSADWVDLIKPVYDWSEVDVFKWFHENDIAYCPIYDLQMYSNADYRVATVLHERAWETFINLKVMCPQFYDNLCEIMPGVDTHFRYWKEVDRFNLMFKYPRTFDGVRQYITENIEPEKHKDAMRFVQGCENFRKDKEQNEPWLPLGNMPVLFVFKEVIRGAFTKALIANVPASREDVDFENGDA